MLSCTSVQKATTPQCVQLWNKQCDSISVQVMAHHCACACIGADDMPLSCLWCMMLCSLDDMFQHACGTFRQLLTSFKSRAASTCVKLYPVEIALLKDIHICQLAGQHVQILIVMVHLSCLKTAGIMCHACLLSTQELRP